MIKRYRKKTAPVVAMEWKGQAESAQKLMEWLETLPGSFHLDFDNDVFLIKTSGGDLRAEPGDYIVFDPEYGLHPCKPDAFASKYQDYAPKASDALGRIFSATGTRTQVALAEVLDVRQSSISTAKRSGSIPAEWIVKLLRQYRLNPDWIEKGEGPMFMVPVDHLPAGETCGEPYGQPAC